MREAPPRQDSHCGRADFLSPVRSAGKTSRGPLTPSVKAHLKCRCCLLPDPASPVNRSESRELSPPTRRSPNLQRLQRCRGQGRSGAFGSIARSAWSAGAKTRRPFPNGRRPVAGLAAPRTATGAKSSLAPVHGVELGAPTAATGHRKPRKWRWVQIRCRWSCWPQSSRIGRSAKSVKAIAQRQSGCTQRKGQGIFGSHPSPANESVPAMQPDPMRGCPLLQSSPVLPSWSCRAPLCSN